MTTFQSVETDVLRVFNTLSSLPIHYCYSGFVSRKEHTYFCCRANNRFLIQGKMGNIPLWVLFLVGTVSSTDYDSVDRLTNKMLEGYNNMVRGSNDISQRTIVAFTFQLVRIVEYDEVNGKLAVAGFFFMQWQDDRMTWDPNQYNGTADILFEESEVWTPHIILSSAHSNFRKLGMDKLPVRFDATGKSYWFPADVFSTSCSPDIYYYPYDTQNCILFFSFWGYGINEVGFYPLLDEVNRYVYADHGLWNLTDSSVTLTEDPAINLIAAVIRLTLVRMPNFYLINMILPIVVTGMLNILVFLLPAESGERVGYSITVLLAIAVFQTIASEQLPPVSRPQISLLCIKLLVDLLLSVLVTTLTIVSLYFYDMPDSRKVPVCLRGMCNVILCRTCRSSRKEKDKYDYVEETYEIYKIVDGQKVTSSISLSDQRSSDEKESKSKEITWEDVGRCSDIVFTVFSLLSFVASNAVFAVLVM